MIEQKYTFLSYAKLNLFLHIIGKNLHNYHNLESIFSLCSLHDEIVIDIVNNNTNTYTISYNGEFAKYINNNDSNNIVNKVCSYFFTKFANKITATINISIQKNIPVGAGLGGGSSNAGTLILAFNNIFKLQLSKQKLLEIAIMFGADVPFFISKNLAFVEETGEKITLLKDFCKSYNKVKQNLKQNVAIVVYPNISLNTKSVFENYNNLIINKQKTYSKPISRLKLSNFTNLIEFIKKNKLKNDLQESAINLCPQLNTIFNIINNYKNIKPRYLNITGSGSAVIAVYKTQVQANWVLDDLLKIFAENNHNFYIKSTTFVV